MVKPDLVVPPAEAASTMRVLVKLEDIVEAMDVPQEWQSFLDPQTGEIVSISGDDRFILDSEEEDEAIDMPDWQLDLRDDWFRYRNEAIRDLARSWLEENGIAYVE